MKAIVIEGQFLATFTVEKPASAGELVDLEVVKTGTAEFITTNTAVTAS